MSGRETGGLDAAKLQSMLRVPSDAACIVLDAVDSTNAEAKRRIAAHTPPPIIVAADAQTSGRGRLGRSFFSPAGCGVYLSIACVPTGERIDALRLTTLACVATARAIEHLTGLQPAIKWVNDLYLDNKKICGILCEGVLDPVAASLTAVIVGIGVNVRDTAYPKELAGVAGTLGSSIPREKFIAAIANEFFALYGALPGAYMPYYRAHSLVLDRTVTYLRHVEEAPCTGRAIEILDDGALVVQHDDGSIVQLRTGEITLRLPTESD